MNSVNQQFKKTFVAIEVVVLKLRDAAASVVQVLKGRSTNPDSDKQYENDQSDKTDLYDEADLNGSFCQVYTANYDGTTCVQQRFCNGSCQTCATYSFAPIDFVKSLFGCVINFLCYPFIPCAIAFLPSSFQFAGYTNTNSLYPCYSKTCCFCVKPPESGFCKFCSTPQCCLVWVSLLLAVAFVILWNFTQDSQLIIQLLLYFENIGEVASVFLFVALFTFVSFPLMWGYVILNLAAGYLYGFVLGILVVVLSVTVGLTVAHLICKKYFSNCVMSLLKKRSNFDQIEAILQVIDGKSGLKVIALTRLTPIPFGFQNGLFAVSSVNLKYYLLASSIGLLPTQALNCYIGSTFRSMEQIVEQDSTTGYFMFLLQVAIGVVLMMFVVQRARKELAEALQNNKPLENSYPEIVDDNPENHHLQSIRCSQPMSSANQLQPTESVSTVINV